MLHFFREACKHKGHGPNELGQRTLGAGTEWLLVRSGAVCYHLYMLAELLLCSGLKRLLDIGRLGSSGSWLARRRGSEGPASQALALLLAGRL